MVQVTAGYLALGSSHQLHSFGVSIFIDHILKEFLQKVLMVYEYLQEVFNHDLLLSPNLEFVFLGNNLPVVRVAFNVNNGVCDFGSSFE